MTASAGEAEASAALRVVLMTVRVKGRAEVGAIAEAARVSLDDARALLDAAAERGELRRLDDPLRWALTQQGRATVTDLNASAGIAVERLAAHYEQFLTHDTALKRAITAWQGDRSTVRVGAIRVAAAAAATLIEGLAEIDRRYASYARRFDRTLARIGAGDASAVAQPGADSLHQVWFELHEDLLVVLGRKRSS